MGRAAVDQRWLEFVRSGQVTVSASVLKASLSTVGLTLLALLSAGMSFAAFQEEGTASLQAWGCAFVAVLVLLGISVTVAPVVRRRRLDLHRDGFVISSRRKGSRVQELGFRWAEIDSVTVYRSSNGEGTTTDDVRLVLAGGGRAQSAEGRSPGFVDLPTGLAMTKKDLASLMETIRLSQS